MEEKAHLVTVPKARQSDSDQIAKPPVTEDTTHASGSAEMTLRTELKSIPKKIMALVVVVILLGAGGLFLWDEYVRHWSTADIEEQVVSDPTENTPGFRHNLAGRTVTVEGKIADVETYETTLGDMSYVYTHGSERIALVVWGPISYEVGDKIEMRVHFEWAHCNDEIHVYSPQIAFPWQVIPSIAVVQDAVSRVRGTVLIPEEIDADTVRIEVFDRYPSISISDADCSLRVGTSSFWEEYAQLLGIWDFGVEIDSISNLSEGPSENGLVDFVDLDNDGWITAGDYFEVSGIERPEEDSGIKTYMLRIGMTNVTDPENEMDAYAGSSYLVITNRGLFRFTYSSSGDNPMTPYARGSASVSGNQVTVTCDRLWEQVSWDNIEIQLTDATNYVTWYPAADGLDGEAFATQNLGSASLGVTEVSCTVTDLAGNGYLNEGDYFVITAPSGFAPSNFTVAMLYDLTREMMFRADFSF